MCMECWKERGSPKLNNRKIRAAVKLVDEVYEQEGGGCGGGLHIIVDDFNIDDSNVSFCEESINKPEYVKQWGAKRVTAETKCLAALKKMNEKERASVLALRDGYFK